MVHDAFLIECPIPEHKDQIQVAKKCMVDAARYVVGGTIQVDEEKHFSNFKQEAKDQEIFTLIQDEIKKFKNRKHGWVPSQKVVKRGYVSLLIYLIH
jgi:hypothetical protein